MEGANSHYPQSHKVQQGTKWREAPFDGQVVEPASDLPQCPLIAPSGAIAFEPEKYLVGGLVVPSCPYNICQLEVRLRCELFRVLSDLNFGLDELRE
jgi:hypothetical protein